ncbi:FecR family protein [Steroidobacter sp.]|uniref:FecR family protein n=1 Tax=Steroidobacter sp. TaxID=1978227 RepID=UPI001A422952|nr:FecR domain-containing protein [Steroidobacter sp.]MBL8269122.1 FecR domain-containing protein [Steroidobacter sp.]
MDAPTLDSTERARRRLLNEQAAAWLLRLEHEPSAETESGFRRWLESSAEHMRAFLEITAIDRDFGAMAALKDVDLDALVEEVREENGSEVVPMQAAYVTPANLVRPQSIRRRTALAAALACIVVGAFSFIAFKFGSPPTYETATGEQRALKLDDGSLVHLNTKSRIAVAFDEQIREVRLLEGEAMFTAERDRRRPFRVVTPSAVIEVVGTRFNVYRRDTETTVSVVEGHVKVAGNGKQISLTAGEQATITRDGQITELGNGAVAKATAWQQRKLTFDHDRLEFVVEQFNRYNKTQLVIDDPQIRARELDGVFNADQPQALLDFLSLEKDLRFARDGDTVRIELNSSTADR